LARVLFAWCKRQQAFRFFRTDRLVSAADGDRYPARRVDLISRCQNDIEAAVQAPDRNCLAGLVDGDHYFDTIADDAGFEFGYN